jgi:hypothetical protein
MREEVASINYQALPLKPSVCQQLQKPSHHFIGDDHYLPAAAKAFTSLHWR